MLIRTSVALLIFVLVALAPARGQDQSVSASTPAPIPTDRPTVTNSSIVVPYGYLQAENGFLDSYSQGQNTADGPETALRFGIAAKTELRLEVPDYFYNVTNGGGPGTGFSDVALGVKQQVGPTPGGFDVSATVSLSFPSGAKTVTSDVSPGGASCLVARPLCRMVRRRNVLDVLAHRGPFAKRHRPAAILFNQRCAGPGMCSPNMSAIFRSRRQRQTLQIGTSLKLGKNQQLDAHYGVGLTAAAVHHFVRNRLRVRFQGAKDADDGLLANAGSCLTAGHRYQLLTLMYQGTLISTICRLPFRRRKAFNNSARWL